MKSLKIVCFIIVFGIIFNSCGGTSYHKEKLTEELQSLVKKELKMNSQAFIVGNTIYLDIELSGIAKKQDEMKYSFELINEAFSIMTRVVLSSDSDVKFAVVNAYPKDKSIVFRIIENIDDVKNYYYLRISKNDFTNRSIIEIDGPQNAKFSIEDRHDISIDEFAGRLIASYIMSDIRSNPLFAAAVSNINLRFLQVENKTLYLSANTDIISEAREVLKLSLRQEASNFLKKYETADIRLIKVIGNGKKPILDLFL
ncbi:MAG: hypothetical protein LBV16_01180 [Elusimicrobiota bacterium]|jgi:hypothetical protein|nr:hypothetical protein [Elusimicrobiota bacterium]